MSSVPQIRNAYENLQSQYAWAPLSESKDQFDFKHPPLGQIAKLINPTNRINYVSASHASFRRDLVKPQRIDPRQYERLMHRAPAEAYKFGLNCSYHVDRPNSVIYSNESGFSRMIDPYLTTMAQDYTPVQHKPNDCITFWNWNTAGLHGGQTLNNRKSIPRDVASISKKTLRKAFSSETTDRFRPPVTSSTTCDTSFAIRTKLITFQPTDRMESSTEYGTYGSNVNCSRIFQQNK